MDLVNFLRYISNHQKNGKNGKSVMIPDELVESLMSFGLEEQQKDNEEEQYDAGNRHDEELPDVFFDSDEEGSYDAEAYKDLYHDL